MRPGFDLRQIENVVDQREQVLPGGMDVVQIVLLLCRSARRKCLLQHFGKADDGVQRRAQLVRHVGEELGLVLTWRFPALGSRLRISLEQASVFNRDHGLISEGSKNGDPFFGEWTHFIASNYKSAHEAVFSNERYGQTSSNAPAVVLPYDGLAGRLPTLSRQECGGHATGHAREIRSELKNTAARALGSSSPDESETSDS